MQFSQFPVKIRIKFGLKRIKTGLIQTEDGDSYNKLEVLFILKRVYSNQYV